jgi:hypothetical protein
VIRHRERVIAQVGGRASQLIGQLRAVEEREGGVGMQLGVHGEHMFA